VRTDLAVAILKTLRGAKIKIPNAEPAVLPVEPLHAQVAGPTPFQLGMTVGYDADPERARDVLLRVARERTVSERDLPKIVFDGFGDGGIKLTLFALAAVGADVQDLRTSVAFTAIKALRDAGVPNASPQHQIRLSDIEPLRRALMGGDRNRTRTPEESVG
jgi:small-conductance mechanosensitive channel